MAEHLFTQYEIDVMFEHYQERKEIEMIKKYKYYDKDKKNIIKPDCYSVEENEQKKLTLEGE
tara:strand:- start:171 stop:356 length:186 start_codon:yes stop_codon:yes gene_type:complete